MRNKLLVSAGSGEGICPWLIDREGSFLLEDSMSSRMLSSKIVAGVWQTSSGGWHFCGFARVSVGFRVLAWGLNLGWLGVSPEATGFQRPVKPT